MNVSLRRNLAIVALFAVGYPVLFEGIPDDWVFVGLPIRVEAVLLPLAFAFGRWGMAGILVGLAILRVSGIDGLTWTYAAAEASTFLAAMLAARSVWLRAVPGWNGLAASGVLTGTIVAGLGTYWTLYSGQPAYLPVFLQAFLAINVIGASVLVGISALSRHAPTLRPVTTP